MPVQPLPDDSPRMMSLRAALVDELRRKGINHPQILDAIGRVRRHAFLESALADRAYLDTALPIDDDQTISQPYTVAYQTELLDLKKGDRVLEIGTGSGYQCAILCEMGVQVFSIERHPRLYEQARRRLEAMNCRAVLRLGDGSLGWPQWAPYDAILVTAACPSIPQPLAEQLAIGGRLVLPVGDLESQTMTRATRQADGGLSVERFTQFRFVPMIGRAGWKPTDAEGR